VFGFQGIENFGYLFSIPSDKTLSTGFQEILNSLPGIAYQASAGSGYFEHSSCGRIPKLHHALSCNVEDGSRGAVKGIVILAVDMPETDKIWEFRDSILPTATPQSETVLP